MKAYVLDTDVLVAPSVATLARLARCWRRREVAGSTLLLSVPLMLEYESVSDPS